MANRLAGETSPYLLQHRDNPVDWYPWGPEALATAQAHNKPILLSVGYAACHWCHVMAHESFENEAIARQMNALFVCIKVDREERPDIDHIYQQALSLLGQQGGWPLTMFLTPQGRPYWGGTYFPPTSRWGRPGFPQVLQALADAYAKGEDAVGHNVAALAQAQERHAQPKPGDALTLDLIDTAAARLLRGVDTRHGGLEGAPKFPHPSVFTLLWQAGRRTGQAAFHQAVLTTLTEMSQGGIYDHLGGGYARYSTDEEWLVPHFEKMLYDNAQILDLLRLAWGKTADPLYRERAQETVGWLLREMRTDDGAFAATLDADSEGEEGRYYVWSLAEVTSLLGPDAPLFTAVYDVDATGNWEGRTILNRLRSRDRVLTAAEQATLARCRATLLAARQRRVRPGWDDKVLADWNGLMIAALALAAGTFERPDWLAAAQTAYDAVKARLTRGPGLLAHSARGGRQGAAALLDDYAALIRAALALHEATAGTSAAPMADYLGDAQAWAATLDRHFLAHHSPTTGEDGAPAAYHLTPDDADDLIVRPLHIRDQAVPAGNAVHLANLVRLALHTGDQRYQERAQALAGAFAGEPERSLVPVAEYLLACELLIAGRHLVIIGEMGAADTAALAAIARHNAAPDLVISVVAPGTRLPDGHPAQGKGLENGRATAYLCRVGQCSLPVSGGEALTDLLGKAVTDGARPATLPSGPR